MEEREYNCIDKLEKNHPEKRRVYLITTERQ